MSPYGAGAPAFGPYSPTSLPPGSPLPAMYTAASPPVYHAPMPVTTTYTAAFAPPMDPPHAEAQPQAPPTVHHNANAPAAPQPAPTVAEPGFWALTATVERMRQVRPRPPLRCHACPRPCHTTDRQALARGGLLMPRAMY